MTGDWDLAEECAQDAFARALETWPRDGVPRNPGAWLTTIARNRAVDRLRRAKVGAAKLHEVAVMTPDDGDDRETREVIDVDDSGVEDDRLRLIFTCCHPALGLEARVALTLRTLAGLTTPEIAHAFLVPEPTMAQRIVRAKRKIRNAGIPYRVPPAHLLPERTTAVLAVLYLLFNEGYAATSGADLVRRDLCEEAIRLARTLTELMPDEPEALGLLALMLLHHARRDGRVDEAGDLIPLEEQDRTRWDQDEIGEGVDGLDAALRREQPGPYQVQAAIAACHATATAASDDRLGRDRDALRRAGAHEPLAGRGAEPRGRGGDGRRSGGRAPPGRRARRERRARRVPPAPRDPRRPAAPPGPPGRGRRGLPRRAGARRPPTPSAATSSAASPSSPDSRPLPALGTLNHT